MNMVVVNIRRVVVIVHLVVMLVTVGVFSQKRGIVNVTVVPIVVPVCVVVSDSGMSVRVRVVLRHVQQHAARKQHG